MTLQQLRHPNILQFLGACMKPPDLCMVTEHMPHSLHGVLYGGSVDLDRKRIVSICQDVARAFVYLHSRKPAVVHRCGPAVSCCMVHYTTTCEVVFSFRFLAASASWARRGLRVCLLARACGCA